MGCVCVRMGDGEGVNTGQQERGRSECRDKDVPVQYKYLGARGQSASVHKWHRGEDTENRRRTTGTRKQAEGE